MCIRDRFKTPEHFEQAANALYNVIGWKNLDNKPSYGDITVSYTHLDVYKRQAIKTADR